MFQPIVLETLDPINESAVQFLNDLSHKITSVSLPTNLYRSAEIQLQLAARVIWD